MATIYKTALHYNCFKKTEVIENVIKRNKEIEQKKIKEPEGDKRSMKNKIM